jgi:hypothetical protein
MIGVVLRNCSSGTPDRSGAGHRRLLDEQGVAVEVVNEQPVIVGREISLTAWFAPSQPNNGGKVIEYDHTPS